MFRFGQPRPAHLTSAPCLFRIFGHSWSDSRFGCVVRPASFLQTRTTRVVRNVPGIDPNAGQGSPASGLHRRELKICVWPGLQVLGVEVFCIRFNSSVSLKFRQSIYNFVPASHEEIMNTMFVFNGHLVGPCKTR